MFARLLDRFATWALSKNAPGGYRGENDDRWAYVIETNGDPYVVRVISPKIFGHRVMLHHILRPDADRYLHNHPWTRALSVILSGSYEEERLDQVIDHPTVAWPIVLTDTKHVRRLNHLSAKDYHRITKLRGDVWTLFFVGPTVQNWGFLVDGNHVDWQDYLKDRS